MGQVTDCLALHLTGGVGKEVTWLGVSHTLQQQAVVQAPHPQYLPLQPHPKPGGVTVGGQESQPLLQDHLPPHRHHGGGGEAVQEKKSKFHLKFWIWNSI